MAAPRVLFIGGTGVISAACARQAVETGFGVFMMNRGSTASRPVPAGAGVLIGDVRDPRSLRNALAGQEFDVVVDFLAFTPDHVRADLDALRGRVGQYIFISSASAYQTPPARLPILESTPLRNPYSQYSRDKIACEELLVSAYRQEGFPVTIVRPSHTYDHTLVPFEGGWTMIERMRRGAAIVVHGDGTSPWTLTHHADFARAFVGLLGEPRAIGDSFHITSDEALTWNQIACILAEAAGATPEIVHVPSDAVAAADPKWGASLLGDKAHARMFDNSKIKSLVPGWAATVPFSRGAREIIEWHDADPSRRRVDQQLDATIDRLAETFDTARPGLAGSPRGHRMPVQGGR
jgi:nucleoside-diphosphate-sugar epimerase